MTPNPSFNTDWLTAGRLCQTFVPPGSISDSYAIRAMLGEVVASKRIIIRDAQSYCAILLDDNNRRPICRLRFNNGQKLRLGLFNEKKEEELVTLESVDDIFNYAERLKSTVLAYVADSAKE